MPFRLQGGSSPPEPAEPRGGDADRIRLFGEVGGLGETSDIPDPWGGGPDEFGHVLDLLGAAAPVIAARLARMLKTVPSE